MSRLLLATISFLSLTACAVDAVPPDNDGEDGEDGKGDDGSEGDGREGSELTVPEYLAAFSMQKCDEAFECMSTFPANSPISFASLYGESESVCYARSAQYYDATAVAASIAAGLITFDGAAAAACISGITAPACGTFWIEGPRYPEACKAALAGHVPDGASCSIDFECENSRSICDAVTKKCGRRVK